MPTMGFRDRLKNRMKGLLKSEEKPREKQAPTPPPKRKVRSKAVYRTGSERRIEGAEHMEAPVETDDLARGESKFGDEELAKRDINTDVTYQVRLINEDEDLDVVITCYEEEYLLDAAERQAVDLPASCRNGGCYVCTGKLVEGDMELGDQYVLEPEHVDEGFRLLCCSWVTSDATIQTHQEDQVT